MDTVFCQFLCSDQSASSCSGFLEPPSAASDSGYYSACSSLSPASSVDSGCFSPSPLLWGAAQEAADLQGAAERKPVPPAQEKRKSRSKYPGRKRQSASEREKLRMRDLTKALHHLRTYLPPSEAPAGQTLTKIETLRLAIRYINHLSGQLGHTENTQFHPTENNTLLGSPEFQDCYQYSSIPRQWEPEQMLGISQFSDSRYQAGPSSQNSPQQMDGHMLMGEACFDQV
nr:mesoderm posterior protein 1-like [Paramormyrops kingsleyae]